MGMLSAGIHAGLPSGWGGPTPLPAVPLGLVLFAKMTDALSISASPHLENMQVLLPESCDRLLRRTVSNSKFGECTDTKTGNLTTGRWS